MITSLRLQNFKNHRSTNISLGRMNVLVGPNSSGKTSILQALFLVDLMNAIAGRFLPGEKCIDYKSTQTHDNLFLQNTEPTDLSTYGVQDAHIICSGQSSKLIWEIKLQYTRGEKNEWSYTLSHNSKNQTEDSFRLPYMNKQEYLDSTVLKTKYLRISVSKIVTPSYTEAIPPQMKNDGSDIASTLAYLMTYDPDKFQYLLSLVQRVIPAVRRIRVRPARIQKLEQRMITIDDHKSAISDNREVIGHELVFDMLSGDTIPAHSVSEGTLAALGILTALVTIDGPTVMLIDDIDQGLHPGAQRTLMDILKELLQEQDNLQIILTTHSPYIVDEVEAANVWVFNTNEGGYVESARLSDHPDAERALQILTTGEFLSAEGEEWVGKHVAQVTTSNA